MFVGVGIAQLAFYGFAFGVFTVVSYCRLAHFVSTNPEAEERIYVQYLLVYRTYQRQYGAGLKKAAQGRFLFISAVKGN